MSDSIKDSTQGPGAGFTSQDLAGSGQGERSGYDQMASSQNDQGMGGGYGAHGSGVAGGYEGSGTQGQGQQQQQPGVGSGSTGQPAEKQDWLDKGITAAGKKFGFNVVSVILERRGAGTCWADAET